MRVRDVLSAKARKLITISPDSLMTRAVDLMSSEGVGALLVVDEQQELVGLLSERDVVCMMSRYKVVALTMQVREVASVPLLMATTETPVLEIMRVMTEERVRHLPVMDGSTIVGIISIGDVLKSRLVEKDLELAVLRDAAGFRSDALFRD